MCAAFKIKFRDESVAVNGNMLAFAFQILDAASLSDKFTSTVWTFIAIMPVIPTQS